MENRKGITEGMMKQTRETSHEVLTERSEACAWPKDVDDAERRERTRHAVLMIKMMRMVSGVRVIDWACDRALLAM